MSIHVRVLNLAVALAAGAVLGWVAEPAGAAYGKPTRSIVLVHGAFADGSSWDKVTPILMARGYTVVAVQQRMRSLADDVAATKRVIDAQPGQVILAGHSYGGVIITEAGNNPKVVGLVYVAAFAPDAGESANDLGKGQPAPDWVRALTTDSGSVFAAKVKTAAWKTRPVWYVMATEDQMIIPPAQAMMASRMNATTTQIKASHLVMLSKPRQVAGVILSAAAVPPLAASGGTDE